MRVRFRCVRLLFTIVAVGVAVLASSLGRAVPAAADPVVTPLMSGLFVSVVGALSRHGEPAGGCLARDCWWHAELR